MKFPTKFNIDEKNDLLKKINSSKSNNTLQKRANISQEELILYSRQKIIKDIQFAKNTIPYIRNYIYFVGSGIFIFSFIWSKYHKKNNISFTRMLFLNLADLEEE